MVNPTPHIDLLHLDGDKATYSHDFFEMKSVLKPNAYIVFDDSQNPLVQELVDRLILENMVTRCEYPQMSPDILYRHEIVKIV